jgi:hypothetical protein
VSQATPGEASTAGLIYAAGTRSLNIIGAGPGRDAGVIGAALAASWRLVGRMARPLDDEKFIKS